MFVQDRNIEERHTVSQASTCDLQITVGDEMLRSRESPRSVLKADATGDAICTDGMNPGVEKGLKVEAVGDSFVF
jgi:hypothetical protein